MSPFLYNYIATFMPNRFIRFINRVLPNRRVIEALYITGISIYSRRRYFSFVSFLQQLLQYCTSGVSHQRLLLTEGGERGDESTYHAVITTVALLDVHL